MKYDFLLVEDSPAEAPWKRRRTHMVMSAEGARNFFIPFLLLASSRWSSWSSDRASAAHNSPQKEGYP